MLLYLSFFLKLMKTKILLSKFLGLRIRIKDIKILDPDPIKLVQITNTGSFKKFNFLSKKFLEKFNVSLLSRQSFLV